MEAWDIYYIYMNIRHEDKMIGDMPAYCVSVAEPGTYPGLILIHEIWGLVPHIRNVADRLAEQGFAVVAPDLFYNLSLKEHVVEELFNDMQNPEKRDETQKKMREFFAPIYQPEFAGRTTKLLKACGEYLLGQKNIHGSIGVIGFCFGGTYSFALAAEDNRIRASVPFYGHPPTREQIASVSCPVLAFYGEQDTRLTETLPQLKADMQEAGKQFEAHVYPNCGHAFFNDTNARMYNQAAAEDAWGKTLSFLQSHLM